MSVILVNGFGPFIARGPHPNLVVLWRAPDVGKVYHRPTTSSNPLKAASSGVFRIVCSEDYLHESLKGHNLLWAVKPKSSEGMLKLESKADSDRGLKTPERGFESRAVLLSRHLVCELKRGVSTRLLSQIIFRANYSSELRPLTGYFDEGHANRFLAEGRDIGLADRIPVKWKTAKSQRVATLLRTAIGTLFKVACKLKAEENGYLKFARPQKYNGFRPDRTALRKTPRGWLPSNVIRKDHAGFVLMDSKLEVRPLS